MHRTLLHARFGICLLVGLGCNQKLPPDAPSLALEFGLDRRADANFCFSEDDPSDGEAPPSFNIRSASACLRITALSPDGSFAGADAAGSSCSIRPNKGQSGLPLADPVGLVLRTRDRK